MARRSDVYGGNFIKATRQGTIDIKELGQGLDSVVLTIQGKLETKEFQDGGSQRACSFAETEMQLGLNATNWDAIAGITNQEDDDGWSGTKIELFTIPMKQSDSGHAIRVRKPKLGVPGTQPTHTPAAQPGAVTVDPTASLPLGKASADALIAKVAAVGATKPGVTVDTLKAHLAATFPAQVSTVAQAPETWPRSWVVIIKGWIDANEKASPEDIPF